MPSNYCGQLTTTKAITSHRIWFWASRAFQSISMYPSINSGFACRFKCAQPSTISSIYWWTWMPHRISYCTVPCPTNIVKRSKRSSAAWNRCAKIHCHRLDSPAAERPHPVFTVARIRAVSSIVNASGRRSRNDSPFQKRNMKIWRPKRNCWNGHRDLCHQQRPPHRDKVVQIAFQR